jgi:nicotinate-nucleotide pyrophosphorylase (carboxylating)
VLIKDNHLALGSETGRFTPAEAVLRARAFLAEALPEPVRSAMVVEVEVDTLEQLDDVLSAGPDIVLLDNLSLEQLREAVARRNQAAPQIELEASGGVRLETVRSIAETGVERISAGALTHAAVSLDVALDWQRRPRQ